MKKARLPHVACGLKVSQPRRESGSNVTEDSNAGVEEHKHEVGQIHSRRPAETGAGMGVQRRYVLAHHAAWQYQMEVSATGHSGCLVGAVRTDNAGTVVCSCATAVSGHVWIGGGHHLSGSHGSIENMVASVAASRSETIAQADGTGWRQRPLASRFVGAAGGRWVSCFHTANFDRSSKHSVVASYSAEHLNAVTWNWTGHWWACG